MFRELENGTFAIAEIIRVLVRLAEAPIWRGRSRWSEVDNSSSVRLRSYLLHASGVPVSRRVGQFIPRMHNSSRHVGR